MTQSPPTTSASPILAAHRGASRRYVENSLAAIKEAINMAMEQPQANFFIELDVRETADKQLVVMHDMQLERTTMGQGRVNQHILAQLQAMPLRPLSDVLPPHQQCPGRVANPTFPIVEADLRIPSAQEVLTLLHDANAQRQQLGGKPIGLALEIKPDFSQRPVQFMRRGMMSAIAKGLDWLGLHHSADIVSPDSNAASLLAQLLNQQTQPLPPMVVFSSRGMAGKRDLEAFNTQLSSASQAQLGSQPPIAVDVLADISGAPGRLGNELIEHSKRFWAVGNMPEPFITPAKPLQSRQDIRQAMQQGATFIMSDYPEMLLDSARQHTAMTRVQPEPSMAQMPQTHWQAMAKRDDVAVSTVSKG